MMSHDFYIVRHMDFYDGSMILYDVYMIVIWGLAICFGHRDVDVSCYFIATIEMSSEVEL